MESGVPGPRRVQQVIRAPIEQKRGNHPDDENDGQNKARDGESGHDSETNRPGQLFH